MENFKPFKGRTISEGQLVDAYYRKDGLISLREPKTQSSLGKCSSITLKDATFYKKYGFCIRGTVTNYKLQSPAKVDYQRLRRATATEEVLHQDNHDANYVKMEFKHQISVE